VEKTPSEAKFAKHGKAYLERNTRVVGLTSRGKTISIIQEYEEKIVPIMGRSTWQGVQMAPFSIYFKNKQKVNMGMQLCKGFYIYKV
jgi:tmRNA-binding protein